MNKLELTSFRISGKVLESDVGLSLVDMSLDDFPPEGKTDLTASENKNMTNKIKILPFECVKGRTKSIAESFIY